MSFDAEHFSWFVFTGVMLAAVAVWLMSTGSFLWGSFVLLITILVVAGGWVSSRR
jgi:uncharacterized membrane protein